MIDAYLSVWRRAGRYALACPILFLIPVAIEIVQHAVEIASGYYRSMAVLQTVEADPVRMILGHAKVISLFLAGYWVARFLAFGEDTRAARSLDPVAMRLFMPVMAWGLLWLLVIQDGPLLARGLGVSDKSVSVALVALLPISTAFEICLAAWKVAAAAGNPAIGFVRSIHLTRGSYWWSLGLSMMVVLPPMAAHYALTIVAIGKPEAAVWALMAIDAALVGYMGAAMVAANYAIAERVAARAGLALAGAHHDRPRAALA